MIANHGKSGAPPRIRAAIIGLLIVLAALVVVAACAVMALAAFPDGLGLSTARTARVGRDTIPYMDTNTVVAGADPRANSMQIDEVEAYLLEDREPGVDG